MASCEDEQSAESKWLCHQCVGDPYLSAEIKRGGKRHRCAYCERVGKSYSIGTMAKRIKSVFAEHYSRTSDQPDSWGEMMLSDRESDRTWERHGDPAVDAIENAANIPMDAAEDIQAILESEFSDFEADKIGEETEFSSDACYEKKGASDRAWQADWRAFEQSLKTEARFFSRSASAHLGSVFSGIEKMFAFDGRPLVVSAGPGSALTSCFRARVFQSDDTLTTALCRPDHHLGPPPANNANAGRMNARGISVFYGATEPAAALAEVRPPVGSQVAVARFTIIRPLRLLDLTAVNAAHVTGSVFDPGLARRTERAAFLRSLGRRITRPIMPDDEVLEYLPTQAIADYLASEMEPPIDGILFESVQVAGEASNIVLFHKAARVEAITLRPGTDVSASTSQMTDEGPETDYAVIEKVLPDGAQEPQKGSSELTIPVFGSRRFRAVGADERFDTLRIELDSITVHVIRRVTIIADEHPVRRHRWVKGEPEF